MTNGEKLEQVFPDGICPFSKNWLDYEYKEPTTKNNLGVDCISRERLKQIVFNITAEYDTETIHIDRLIDEIDDMPSVTPQPKTGHWIKGYTFPDGAYWKCDKCNELIKVKIPMRYCNNCGAKMVEPQEREG